MSSSSSKIYPSTTGNDIAASVGLTSTDTPSVISAVANKKFGSANDDKNTSAQNSGLCLQDRHYQPMKCRKTGPRKTLSNGTSPLLTHYFSSVNSKKESNDSLDINSSSSNISNVSLDESSRNSDVSHNENDVRVAEKINTHSKSPDFSEASEGLRSSENTPCGSARKQPKARKTVHTPTDSSPAKMKTPDSRPTRAKIGFSRSSSSIQSVTLADLEKALGIEGQSIDKIDARTFDRIIISKMQEKLVSRNGYKLSPTRASETAEDAKILCMEQTALFRKREFSNLKESDASSSGALNDKADSLSSPGAVTRHEVKSFYRSSPNDSSGSQSKRALSDRESSESQASSADHKSLVSPESRTCNKLVRHKKVSARSWCNGAMKKPEHLKKKSAHAEQSLAQLDSTNAESSSPCFADSSSPDKQLWKKPNSEGSPSRTVAKKMCRSPRVRSACADVSKFDDSPTLAKQHQPVELESAENKVLQELAKLPATPPSTPDDSNDTPQTNRLVKMDQSHVMDLVTCCCKLPGLSLPAFSQIPYCQALDSIDGKVSLCGTKVTTSEQLRPSRGVTFRTMCDYHQRLLRLHQCCPGCGQFCTQGKFIECRAGVNGTRHYFHKQCQTFYNSKLYCPHCGAESLQCEAIVRASDIRPTSCVHPADMTWQEVGSSKTARFNHKGKLTRDGSVDSEAKSIASVASSSASLSTQSNAETRMSSVFEQSDLDAAYAAIDKDKMKKIRVCHKSLLNACRLGDLDKVLYVLNEGVDPRQKSDDGQQQTALHIAARAGHHQIVFYLLLAGANANEYDAKQCTPLMAAAESGHAKVVDILLVAGASAQLRGKDDMTTLHMAAQCGHNAVVRMLLEKSKLDINSKDAGGWTPLVWATENRHLDTVQYLLSKGGDPCMKDKENNTALHWAAFAGSVELTQIFLDAGCGIDMPNEHGDRPLHIAARQDHYECVKLLLLRGASTGLINVKSETPTMCCFDQNGKVAQALNRMPSLRSGVMGRPSRILHQDITLGRETHAIAVVNQVDDDENYPSNFLYVNGYVETCFVQVNRCITSLQHCYCCDNCSTDACVCVHQSVKCWYDADGHLTSDFNFSDPPLIFECNLACRCFTTCNNRVVQQGITCTLQVFKTSGRGWGCKTLADIPRGTFVCEYAGELITDAEADRREDDSYLFDLDNQDADTYCIDAAQYGNVSRFINHLCEPNLIPVKVFIDHHDLRFPRMCFFANRDIKVDEELGFDYGDKFWLVKYKQFTCACASPKCRYSKDTIAATIEEYNRRENIESSPDASCAKS